MSAPGADEPRRGAAATAGDGDPGAAGRGRARPADAAEPDAMLRGYARSRAKADAIRAQLRPLGPDERPLGIKLAVALALFVAVANLAGAVAGVGGESPAVGVAFALGMTAVAAGLWARVYLVLLLFQALLALSIIVSALSLAVAGNLLAVVLSAVVIGACSPIFWLLVRVMARLQVPRG